MSEEKRYLDEQWGGGPLPDEEKAWQHMQHLLDEEEKKRRVLPLWFWRYAGFGLLLIGLGLGTNYFLSKDQTITQKGSVPLENSSKQNNTNAITTNSTADKTSIQAQEPTATTNGQSLVDNKVKETIKVKAAVSQTNDLVFAKSNGSQKKKNRAKKFDSIPDDFKEETSVKPSEKTKEVITPAGNTNIDPVKAVVVPSATATPLKDSAVSKIAEPIVSNKKSKKEKPDPVEFSFSAGVGLQRAIAFNGQQSSEYNYNGNRSIISDYIPSVYVRYQKRNWFAQAEFQYAVPLPVKQFVFRQKTSYSVATQNMSTEQVRMQKLYYHHLPVSINYVLLPDWSVGTGLMYSILKGAVTEQEVTTKNVQTGNESVSKNIAPVKGFKDSFLYKTTAGIILQTDYQVKRFSMGLRYTQNFLAFIRYTTPTGEVVEEKNKTLQAILRFRLFEK